MSEPLLQAIDVVKEFPGPRIGPLGLKRATVHAVNGVSLSIAPYTVLVYSLIST